MIWHVVLSEDHDLPRLGTSSLNAEHLVQYFVDGKEEKDGCSLSLEKSEEGSEMKVTILEQRSERRPPIKIMFLLTKSGKEERLSLLGTFVCICPQRGAGVTQRS
uniref:Uncharacterized protein n=1 Tax=Paramoeba aestuarina TaxID=180227 RepID=A0A7S4KMN5_9EUKA